MPGFFSWNVGTSASQRKPRGQFRLLDLFVLTTLAGTGLLVYQLASRARLHSATTLAILTVSGTLSMFVAYLYPNRRRVVSTVLLLIVYAIIIIARL
jgi:hypothetical protein